MAAQNNDETGWHLAILVLSFPHFNKNVNNVYSLSLKAENSWHDSIIIYIDGWQATACHIWLFDCKKKDKKRHKEKDCDKMHLLQDWYLAFRYPSSERACQHHNHKDVLSSFNKVSNYSCYWLLIISFSWYFCPILAYQTYTGFDRYQSICVNL